MKENIKILDNLHTYYQPPILIGEYFLRIPRNGTHTGMHWHIETEIIHCLTGDITVTLEGNSYDMRSGDTVLIRSTSEHNVFIRNGESIIVEFGYSMLGPEYRLLSRSHFCNTILHRNDDLRFETIFKELRECMMSERKNIWLEKSRLFLLASILQSYCVPSEIDDTVSMKRVIDFEKILPAIQLVESRYTDALQVSDAAKATGYTEAHFCRLFHSIMGETFHTYLNRYRILTACKLLEQGNYGIYETAVRVGMPIEKTFTRTFKRYMWCTPAQYLHKMLYSK